MPCETEFSMTVFLIRKFMEDKNDDIEFLKSLLNHSLKVAPWKKRVCDVFHFESFTDYLNHLRIWGKINCLKFCQDPNVALHALSIPHLNEVIYLYITFEDVIFLDQDEDFVHHLFNNLGE